MGNNFIICTIYTNTRRVYDSNKPNEYMTKIMRSGSFAMRVQLKNKSCENVKERVTHFVHRQSVNPPVVEDDHYKTWRYHRQYRDVQDANKFIGFKSFRHKPNYDIGKHFSERQRKQISYLASRSKKLVDSQLIPDQHVSRSLRSQGPLAPKHTFRQKKKDHQLLQPRMRYTNITDKQRLVEASMTFDDKFSKVYKSYSLNKSKIGQTTISPLKDKQKNLQVDMMSSTFSQHNNLKPKGYFYSADNQEDKQLAMSKFQNFNSSKMVPEQSFSSQLKKNKFYFKTAKTMALQGHKQAHNLMVETQYDRKKDLTNLNKNNHHEVFVKRPIL